MESREKIVKYPDNLALKEAVLESGKSVKHLAKKIKVSTVVLSLTINGHYKGVRISELLKQELSK